jgi:hypothetical protein
MGASHHVSVHMAKQFQRFLEITQPETRIDDALKVSGHALFTSTPNIFL